jgi:hypothetical protein
MSRKDLINQVLNLTDKKVRLKVELENNIKFFKGLNNDNLINTIIELDKQISRLNTELVVNHGLL